jgi:prepilin-type N-terminal cleavage/methylation domain-containing protein
MARQPKQLPNCKRKRDARGFSLIELLIVVGIILIIAALAIPNFIRSKMRANESSAVENMRTITTAEVVYSTTYGIGFSPTLPALGGSPAVPDATQAGLIDSVLTTGTKSGFNFSFTVVTTDSDGHVTNYSVNADPIVPGTSGDRHFYTDQSAIIRQNDTAIAGPNDPSLQ